MWQGCFRLPHDADDQRNFAYGGSAIGFNPSRGSLFVVGMPWYQLVAEVSVPAVDPSTPFASLPTATLLQPLTDPTEGHLRDVQNPTATVQIGGLLPVADALIVTAFDTYDGVGGGSQRRSHFIRPNALDYTGHVDGPFISDAAMIGTQGKPLAPAGFVAGYMATIPSKWQGVLRGPMLTGQSCISTISRSSYGPCVFAFDPAEMNEYDVPFHVTPLVGYPQPHPLGDYSGQNDLFNGATQMGGVCFPEGTDSVLFFGRQGTGPYWYGEPDATRDPADNGKGDHAFPYRYQVWAYDARELAEVAAGRKQPWEPQPYAVWGLDLPFAEPNTRVLGIAYDGATGRIFLSQYYGDWPQQAPLIHVFTVKRH